MNEELKSKIESLTNLSPKELAAVPHQDFADVILGVLTLFAGYLRPKGNWLEKIPNSELRVVLNEVAKRCKGFPSLDQLISGLKSISEYPEATDALRWNAESLRDSLAASDDELAKTEIEGSFLRSRRPAAEFYEQLRSQLNP